MLKDKKVNIWGLSKTEDSLGQVIYEDTLLASGIWAHYRHLSGREYFTSHYLSSEVEAVFTINWREDIDTSMKIEFRGEKYNITNIDDFEGYKNDLKIYAYRKD